MAIGGVITKLAMMQMRVLLFMETQLPIDTVALIRTEIHTQTQLLIGVQYRQLDTVRQTGYRLTPLSGVTEMVMTMVTIKTVIVLTNVLTNPVHRQ